MISLKELNPHNYPTTPEIDANLLVLLNKINQVRTAYGIPMIVTSGLRDQAQQQQLIAEGKSNAPRSHHLTGEAVDIYDPDGKLHEFTLNNQALMESIGLYMETRQGSWQHYQIVAPASGKRWFNP
jgi:uncharacterized protein YcbK (DUF882 family)